MSRIPFGSFVRDNITGFEGLVTYRVEHMNSCIRYGVQALLDNEGQLPDAITLDGPNLKIINPPKSDLPPAVKTEDVFELGVKVRDRLTGFTGIAVLRFKHMYSGDRYAVQPPINGKGEIPDLKVFDEEDLEQIDPVALPKKQSGPKTPAGPHNHKNAIER